MDTVAKAKCWKKVSLRSWPSLRVTCPAMHFGGRVQRVPGRSDTAHRWSFSGGRETQCTTESKHTHRPGHFSFLFLPPPQVDWQFFHALYGFPSHCLTVFGDRLPHVPQVQNGFRMGLAQCMALSIRSRERFLLLTPNSSNKGPLARVSDSINNTFVKILFFPLGSQWHFCKLFFSTIKDSKQCFNKFSILLCITVWCGLKLGWKAQSPGSGMSKMKQLCSICCSSDVKAWKIRERALPKIFKTLVQQSRESKEWHPIN